MELTTAMATEADFDAISGLTLEFSAYETGNVQVWRNEDGEIVAVARWGDTDINNLHFFEVVRHFRDCGLGAQIIRNVLATGRVITLEEIDGAACARFWHRLGFPVDGRVLANGRVWHAPRD